MDLFKLIKSYDHDAATEVESMVNYENNEQLKIIQTIKFLHFGTSQITNLKINIINSYESNMYNRESIMDIIYREKERYINELNESGDNSYNDLIFLIDTKICC